MSVSLDGIVVSGSLRPTSELPLHLLCYTRHGAVAVAEYAPFGTDELAGNVSAALAHRNAAVMRHHGTVVLGVSGATGGVAGSLRAAHDGAAHLEWLCDVWLRAAAAGNPRLLSEDQVADAVERFRGYGQAHGR